MSLMGMIEAASSWVRVRTLAHRLRSPADVEAHQQRMLTRWLRNSLPRVGYYRAHVSTSLEHLPVVDKAELMGRFSEFNVPRITSDEGWQALGLQGRVRGYHVGASTGTSGNRGLYVISERERWRWLGVIVAKTMPRLRHARVALVLPRSSSLYEAARHSALLELRFVDLNGGMEAVSAEIAAFTPDTIIAPPKVLRWLAEREVPQRGLVQLFSTAEVLDPLDRDVIEARFGRRLGQIYMATEGLLGVSCEYGTLHLCEDTMAFEFEPVPGNSDLVSPLITDFSRDTQIMARYRMNDLLRLADAPCPCGSPLQAVAQVEGRADDILIIDTGSGNMVLTPDIVRNAIVGADRRISDFRLVQTGPADLELALPANLPDEAAMAALAALKAMMGRLHTPANIALIRPPHFAVTAGKLRRVERRWAK